MADENNLRAAASLADWYTAWRFITEISAAELYGVDIDMAALLADYDQAEIIKALLSLVWAFLGSFGPTCAAAVVQRWGMDVARAEGVAHERWS
ncbi:hypothetical protein GCM10009839_38910 [Catenulispora yoronensis]|uniref:Uncharacterized protein n=1 Tax=Catenulispora yoronensis TaxID=450799 RepID=A0ABP5FUX0_9ACTN